MYVNKGLPWAFYNDTDPYCAEWLRNLMRAGLIPRGHVDERSISEIAPEDLNGFTQVHMFAGIGGWSAALRQAGWPDDRPIWTCSCPCQPFSVAGRGLGVADERHLWPDFFRLIRACRPSVCMGEQVGQQAGYDWLAGVVADLEGEAYQCEYVDIPAASVASPQKRNRIYWVAERVADSSRSGRREERPVGRREPGGNGAEGRSAGLNTGGPRDDGWVAYAEHALGRSEHQTNGDSYGRNGSGRSGESVVRLAHSLRPRLEGWPGERRDARQECASAERNSDGRSLNGRMGHSASNDQRRNALARSNGTGKSVGRPSGDVNLWESSVLLGPDRDGRYRRIGVSPQSRPSGVAAGLPSVLAPPRSNGIPDEGSGEPVVVTPISPLAPRTPVTAAQLSAFGNSICVPLATEVIRAWMEVERE